MTDNEIIKAFKCLCGEEIFCRECKYSGHIYYPECRQQVAKDTLDLINRLKADNKKLVNIPPKDPMDFCGVVCNYAEELIEKAKTEAVKEFAERLKRRMGFCDLPNGVVRDHIDLLLKEMGCGDE